MANDLTLEQEFNRCKQAHMITICMSALMYDLECKATEGLHIPFFLVREQAEQTALEIVREANEKGLLNKLYNDSWELIEKISPNILGS